MENRSRTLKTVQVVRYATPLREGGSLPAIVEADDDGYYVVKFRGAGQGIRALIAELLSSEIARTLALPVPEVVFADLDATLSRTEPDPEIQELLKASNGLNLAFDYLPGSITYDPLVEPIDPMLASQIVWFDSYVMNIDRTPRNPNLLMWHRQLWLIDHGASLYFHHKQDCWSDQCAKPFAQIAEHILLPEAKKLAEVGEEFRTRLTSETLRSIVSLIPEEWISTEFGNEAIADVREGYLDFFERRLASSDVFLKEALDARKTSV